MCHLFVMHTCGKNTKRHFFYLWYICNNLRLAQKYSFWLREYSFWHREIHFAEVKVPPLHFYLGKMDSELKRWNWKKSDEKKVTMQSKTTPDEIFQTKIILWNKTRLWSMYNSFESLWNWIKVIECIWVGRKLREDIRIQRKWMKKKNR